MEYYDDQDDEMYGHVNYCIRCGCQLGSQNPNDICETCMFSEYEYNRLK